MAKEKTLEEIKEIIDRIKEDIAIKRGERQAALKVLEQQYGIKTVDAAYKELSKLERKIQDTQREKADLMAKLNKKLAEFGYA